MNYELKSAIENEMLGAVGKSLAAFVKEGTEGTATDRYLVALSFMDEVALSEEHIEVVQAARPIAMQRYFV